MNNVEAELFKWFSSSELSVVFNGETIAKAESPSGFTRERFGVLRRVEICKVYPQPGVATYLNRGVLIAVEESPVRGLSMRLDSGRFSRSLPSGVERNLGYKSAMGSLEGLLTGPFATHLLSQGGDQAWGCLAQLVSRLGQRQRAMKVIPSTAGSKFTIEEVGRMKCVYWSPRAGPRRVLDWDGKSTGLSALVRAINPNAALLPLADRLEIEAGPWFP